MFGIEQTIDAMGMTTPPARSLPRLELAVEKEVGKIPGQGGGIVGDARQVEGVEAPALEDGVEQKRGSYLKKQ